MELRQVKNGELYLFRYPPGQELEALNAIAAACEDPRSGLAWSDAAVLSLQIPDPAVRASGRGVSDTLTGKGEQ